MDKPIDVFERTEEDTGKCLDINVDDDTLTVEDSNVFSEFEESVLPVSESNEILEDICEFANIVETPVQPKQDEMSIALLHPDDPLLSKFQQTLKDFLQRTKVQLYNEIEDIKYNLKQKEQQREQQGATLYEMQQEIHRQNDQLEDFTKQIEENVIKRREQDDAVNKLKIEYDEKAKIAKDCKTFYSKRMVELEHMQELELNVRNWVDDVEDEVKNAKRVVSRDSQLQKQISEEKRKSDLLLYHLDTEVKKCEKELEILKNDIADMNILLNELNINVSSANTDLQILENEHKHLTQSWSEVIVAISLRNRILYQVQLSLNKEKESIKNNIANIEGIKKQIKKEGKLNEKLKVFKQNVSDALNILRQDCKQQSDILDGLLEKLNDIPNMLQKTEVDLKEARKEGIRLGTELNRLRVVLDKWNNKKYELEENMLKMTQDQLVTDKANAHRLKLIRNAQDTRRGLELTLAKAQNQLSQTLLDIERNKNSILRSKNENEDLKDNYIKLEQRSDDINSNLKHMEINLDLRMKNMEKLMQKLSKLKATSETESGNQTELKIKIEEKAIQNIEQQVRQSQQIWIMLQNHFVKLTEKRNIQLNQMQITRKQLSIIRQKSLKLDQDLENAKNSTRELDRDLIWYQSKLEQQNIKIFTKRQQHDKEENDCQHEHGELLAKLKINEMEVLRLEELINELQNEIDCNKNIVLDKHRESLSWETKYKLIEETIRWRKSEYASNSELGAMRGEIHRMQVRYQQLKRVQDKLCNEFECSVMHREHIFEIDSTKQNIESQPHRVKQSIQSIQHKISDMRSKLKHLQNEINLLTDQQLITAKCERNKIEQNIKQIHCDIEEEIKTNEDIVCKIEESILLKHQKLELIVRKQNRIKSYRRLLSSTRPIKLSRSESTIHILMAKQRTLNDHLCDIIQTLIVQFPDKLSFLTKLLQILKD